MVRDRTDVLPAPCRRIELHRPEVVAGRPRSIRGDDQFIPPIAIEIADHCEFGPASGGPGACVAVDVGQERMVRDRTDVLPITIRAAEQPGGERFVVAVESHDRAAWTVISQYLVVVDKQ